MNPDRNKNRKTVTHRVHFVGAGPGDPDLLTIKGMRLLEQADVVIYAGSLISPEVLELCPKAERIDSAPLCLDYIVEIMVDRVKHGKRVVRLHSGDPAFFGAIKEQIAKLREASVDLEVVPGVSSLGAAAAAISSELTVPGVSQTVIVTRAAGRTPVPEREDIAMLAEHRATMAVFLSAGLISRLHERLAAHYPPETPVVIVQQASWPQEKVLRTNVQDMREAIREAKMDRTAIILIGAALAQQGEESKLYSKEFSHGYRQGESGEPGES
ncbi:MAG: precorrin-4 C(11)-methyltransferase [Thermoleophilia bacterium]|nr:precorrin-4 C(11)-methyltransferase [Thermoleophilia bacterium]